MLPTYKEIVDASKIIYKYMQPTPQYVWPLLSKRTGCEIWIKHENHAPTGAFKVRGGIIYMDELAKKNLGLKGIIAATKGNHGQSLAFAASRKKIKTIIVVPKGNSKEKNAAMEALGAKLIEHGEDFQQALEYAEQLSKEDDLHFIPSFDPILIKGVSTYSMELLTAAKNLDTVYVPIGLGSGICGMIAAREAMNLDTKIVGVVSKHAPAYALSFEKRAITKQPALTKLADGMACSTPVEQSLELIWKHVDRIIQVSDKEVANAMNIIFSDTHNIAEGSGATGLAALLQENEKMAGKKVGVIITGQNVDKDIYKEVLKTI